MGSFGHLNDFVQYESPSLMSCEKGFWGAFWHCELNAILHTFIYIPLIQPLVLCYNVGADQIKK